MLSKSLSVFIDTPVFGIFEAKDNSLEHWYRRCGAEMYAAQIFNKQKNKPIQVIHGAVTNGLTWQFLHLEGLNLTIDAQFYTINRPEILLGILQRILDFYDE